MPSRAASATAPRMRGMRRMAGFTLLEVIVVISLVALIATLVTTTIGSGLGSARIRAAGKEVAAALKYTRAQAIVKREAQVLLIDTANRTFTAPGRDAVELPRELEVKLLTAAEELVDDSVGGIRFFPDGASTGGHVELLHGDARWRVDVNWLTGEVLLQAPAGPR